MLNHEGWRITLRREAVAAELWGRGCASILVKVSIPPPGEGSLSNLITFL
jgi:hypothetical protein